eukprot:Seg5114.3 transcript_id=Seg5114.3/GoldUCD/mRNA.D3Y31 product="hypothetical protein" pseudo=true protein_id=Seg5114.3/GoldUCD/D3Y31
MLERRETRDEMSWFNVVATKFRIQREAANRGRRVIETWKIFDQKKKDGRTVDPRKQPKKMEYKLFI